MQQIITFQSLYDAYRECRRYKRHTANAQRYEMALLDNLFETLSCLHNRSYSPTRSIRFIAQKPKAREIHAAYFSYTYPTGNRIMSNLYTQHTALCAGILSILTSLLAPPALAQSTLQCANENTATTATTLHLTDNNDGTITDAQAGLIWKKCSEGQSWDSANNTCTGSAQSFNWQQALQQAQNVNAGSTGEALGQSDWRVPNIKELTSIAELRCYTPAVNLTVFPNTPSSGYWSSSPYAPFGNKAWNVGFNGGGDSAGNGISSYYVRLVRSGQ